MFAAAVLGTIPEQGPKMACQEANTLESGPHTHERQRRFQRGLARRLNRKVRAEWGFARARIIHE